MRKVLIAATVALTIVPNALAGPAPTASDRSRALYDCQKVRPAMNGAVGAGTFGRAFGTARLARRDAFGRCVSRFTREEHQSRHAAVEACWAMQNANADNTGEPDSTPASEPPADRNAFGECVSTAMSGESRSDRRGHVNAARACAAERESNPTFAADYGGGRDAYGRCVATKAQAQD